MFLSEEELERIWNPDDQTHESIMSSLRLLSKGLGDIQDAPVKKINSYLHLIPGDLALAGFESDLSEAWGKCLAKDERSFRIMSSFYRIAHKAAKKQDADLILFDVGPNFGAINRAALISSDQVVVPLAPDLFSIQGLRNLGPTLKSWRDEWSTRKGLPLEEEILLPQGTMNLTGYVVIQFGIRDNRPVKAYEKWEKRIPETFNDLVLQNEIEQSPTSYGEDYNCLGFLKHYRSLMPLAMEARKPIFKLKPADGAIGAHTTSVKNCEEDFKDLADSILKKL